MIYVCIPSHDEAPTIGLLLWKIRKIFQEFPREYQLLVADDGSTDSTAELLEPYSKVLPLTIVRHGSPIGEPASVEELLRLALERTDRPKRDCAIVMHADFSHGPEFLPELVKQIESGADLVVAEGTLRGEPSRGHRWLRRWAPLLLRGRISVPGVRDVVSGFAAVRLVSLRNAIRAHTGPMLTTVGWAARAELIGRLAAHARRVESVATIERHDLRSRPSRSAPWAETRRIWGARRRLEIVPARQPRPDRPGTPRAAEVV